MSGNINIMKRGEFIVRDMRVKTHYMVDDEYLNGYAEVCGIYATGVYNVLCRHADFHTQVSFPSIELISKKLGISPTTVKRALNTLMEYGIIKKDRVRNPKTGRWKHNSYTLVNKIRWVPIHRSSPMSSGSPNTLQDKGSVGDRSSPVGSGKPQVSQTRGATTALSRQSPQLSDDITHGSVVATKDTHSIKDTHIEGYIDQDPSSESFTSFWKQYPKKVGKTTAQNAWRKLLPSKVLQTQILEALEKHKRSRQWTDESGRYIPNPATWINQKRWEDELAEVKSQSKAY